MLSAGTFAVVSIIVGNICNELAPESDFQYFNHTTNETSVNTVALEAARLEISATLACLTAIIQVGALLCPLAHNQSQALPGAEVMLADA